MFQGDVSLSLKRIIVGPDPTTTRTVIGNRANHRVMVLVDGLNMFAILLVIIVVGVRRSLSNVAHPVPSLNKINVDENMFVMLLVIIVVGVRRSLSNVAHPVPSLNKINVDED